MFIGDTMKRNKLNNRGFAISTALYGLLTLTILILVLIFQVNRTGSNNSKELGEEISHQLEERQTCINDYKNSTQENAETEYKKCLEEAKKSSVSANAENEQSTS